MAERRTIITQKIIKIKLQNRSIITIFRLWEKKEEIQES